MRRNIAQQAELKIINFKAEEQLKSKNCCRLVMEEEEEEDAN